MVITPEQASELTGEEETEIKALEERVDQAIRQEYNPDNQRELYLDDELFGGYGTRVYTQMKKMYEQAGWNLKYESDQRDGDFVRLSHGRK